MDDELVPDTSDVVADAIPTAPAAPVEKPVEVPRSERALERMQQRIDELTYRLRETERQSVKAAEPEIQAPKVAPVLADFAFDEGKFQQAQAEWQRAEIDRAVAERLSKAEQQQQVKTREQTFREREKAFAQKNADYAEKVYESGVVPISDAMAEEITDSEFGPELALYFANHRDVARQLYELPARQVAREIGRIEATFVTSKAPAPPPATVKVSQAPPPTPKIEAVEPDVESDPSKMTGPQFAKWRRKYMKK
jgi:hypothetical protein